MTSGILVGCTPPPFRPLLWAEVDGVVCYPGNPPRLHAAAAACCLHAHLSREPWDGAAGTQIAGALGVSLWQCQATVLCQVAGLRALSFVAQMTIGIPKVQINQVMSKPLPLQHPSPPRPCIVLALPTFSLLRLERPSSVHRRALAPHRAPPCSILSPVHAHLPSHLFRPRTDVSFSSLVRGGLEGF